MSDIAEHLAERLRSRFAAQIEQCIVHAGQVTAVVPASALLEVAVALRDDPELAFGQLVDLCGIDYLQHGQADWETSDTASSSGFSRGVQSRVFAAENAIGEAGRYAVVYQLLSLRHNRRLRLRVYAEGEPPRVASVVDVWAAADWYEREAFDLFGILFDGHPDLRRLLSDYGFVGHPFRKDYPLIGEVEMRYDPEKRRVVYEPVSIEPRTLVPRVIRDDARYARPEEAGDA